MNELNFDPTHTAFVGIDLHAGLNLPYAPYTYQQVSDNAVKLANAAAKAGAFIDLTQIPVTDGKDRVMPKTDMDLKTGSAPIAKPELLPELAQIDGVHVTPKIAWSGFYGTDLEMELRRRHIDTIVLFGVATEYGVDTTARDAYDRGYNQIFVEDAMTAWSQEAQTFETETIFPKMGQVRSTQQVIDALNQN